jgi:hypothetical protein
MRPSQRPNAEILGVFVALKLIVFVVIHRATRNSGVSTSQFDRFATHPMLRFRCFSIERDSRYRRAMGVFFGETERN